MIKLRLPPKTRPLTRNKALRATRNVLREPLYQLTLLLRKYPSAECFAVNPILGYSASQLKDHIEALFESDMTWENSHLWSVEHIVPIHHYLSIGTTDVKKVNALKNLKPSFDSRDSQKDAEERVERRRAYMRSYMSKYSKTEAYNENRRQAYAKKKKGESE